MEKRNWKIFRNDKYNRDFFGTFNEAWNFCEIRMKKCPHEDWCFE